MPLALKVFLTTLAIVDDLGAIVIIAIFYTGNLSALAARRCAGAVHRRAWRSLNALRRARASRPTCCSASLLWVLGAEIGRARHAGRASCWRSFIPLKSAGEADDAATGGPAGASRCKPWSAFFIMPVFAFANAGLPLAGRRWRASCAPLPLGIVAGLFLGKQIGIFAGAGLLIVLGVAAPAGRRRVAQPLRRGDPGRHRLHHEPVHRHARLRRCGARGALVRLGVLAGSLLSAVVGLRVALSAWRRR